MKEIILVNYARMYRNAVYEVLGVANLEQQLIPVSRIVVVKPLSNLHINMASKKDVKSVFFAIYKPKIKYYICISNAENPPISFTFHIKTWRIYVGNY